MNTETQQDIAQIEITMEQAKMSIDKMEALIRLENHPDWKLIIGNGYFEKEAIRLVALKADVQMQGDNEQRDVLRQIDAIGSVREYLRSIYYFGRTSENSLAADRETHTELLNEDVTNG